MWWEATSQLGRVADRERDLQAKHLQLKKLLGSGHSFDVKSVVVPALGTSENRVILEPTQRFFELCAATRSGAGEA